MEKKIVLKAGFHERNFCLASYGIGEEFENIRLIDPEKNEEIPSQYENGKLFWMVDRLEKGGEKGYLISEGKGKKFQEMELEEKENTVDVKLAKNLFTTYHFGKDCVRPFLNPVIGPTGDSVLRELFDKPEPPDHDHIHHRGMLVAHGDVNGVDDWSEEKGHGFIRHNSFIGIRSGSVFARIIAENSWVSNEEKMVLDEIREMKFYNVSDVRIIDFKIIFKVTEGKVVFGDTKEGGIISVRVPTSMRGDRQGRIENSYGGTDEKETWGKRAHWCDYSGKLGSEIVGMTIFDNPDNFRYPTYWHVRNYGLMTANPFALSHYYNDKSRDGSYVLEANGEFKFCYRIFIHKGNPEEAKVHEAFHNYINPPEIEEKK